MENISFWESQGRKMKKSEKLVSYINRHIIFFGLGIHILGNIL